jgi:hypothetical protein
MVDRYAPVATTNKQVTLVAVAGEGWSEVQQGSHSLGLIVDRVDGVSIIPAGAVEPVAAIVQDSRERQLLRGLARVEDRLVLLLDLARVCCHTLTDPSILGDELLAAGFHTLTLFGLDVPYRLFEQHNDAHTVELLRRYHADLNNILREPIEECLAQDVHGEPYIEIKTPLNLERELALNRGNIFHGALSWFFVDHEDDAGLWGVETPYERVYRCGASAVRGGAVSGIPGRKAAQRIFAELSTASSYRPVHVGSR